MATKNDYSGCSFVWRWKGRRPTAVRHMVEERAFKSFGLDVDVLKNVWTGGTPCGAPENEVFPRIPREDICCADTVGWTAFQTGVVDFLGSRKLNVHWVDTYFPFKQTVHGFDFAKLVGVYGPDDRAKGLDDANFLPGDYFIYVRVKDWTIGGDHKVRPAQRIADGLAGTEEKVPTVGDHINLWLGPFEAFQGSTSMGTFDQINGSYGTNNGNEYVWPVDRGPYWKWEWDNGTYVVHCRFKAIEQLFKELVGPPLRPPPRTGKSSSVTADLDAFWQATRDAQAPYPVGLHLGWHQGVHAKAADGASDADKVVYAMAPGQVVAARCASPGLAEGDASFVLLKHQLVKSTRRVVDPTDPPGGVGADALQPFFSLSMHLAPLTRFLGKKSDTDVVPPLLPDAPGWLRGLWPRPIPAGVIPAATPQVLLAPKDGDPDKGWVSLGSSPKHLVQQPVSLAGLKRVSAGGVDYYLVPAPGDPTTSESAKLAAAWTGRPATPITQNALVLYNPRTKKVYKTQVSLDGWAHLAITQSDDGSQHLVVEKVDGAEYAHVDQYLHPALRRTGRPSDFTTDAAPVDGRPDLPEDVLVLPPRASRGDAWDIYLTTTVTSGKVSVQGPGATLRFADIVDADAETARKQDNPDDKTTHTTVGVRDPAVPTGDAGAGTTTGFYWLDLVPCVKLAKSSQDIEATLNGDQARIRRAATDRLKKGTTRLLGIVASSKDGSPWTVDSEGFAVSGQSSTAPNALYTTLKARTAGFGVDPKDKNALTPDGSASASLHAVDVCPGPTKGTTNVAVEIAFAVNAKDVDQANQQALDAAKADADKRKALVDDLLAGKIVDLRARAPAPVLVAREPIGAFGTIVGAPGEKGTPGVHLEMFAGSPIGVDGSPALGDKKLTPVAGSPWLAFKDTSAGDLLSSRAARMIVRELVTRQGAGFQNAGLEQLPPEDDAAPWPAPSREEWQKFCDAHERILARVAAVHPSEWALDWPESASKDGSTQKFQTAGMGSSVKDVHASLAWTKGPGAFQFAADEGIADPTAIVYHHPARVIEMLRTAIEVTVSTNTAGAAAKATVTFTPKNEAAIKLTLIDGAGTFGGLVPTSEATDVAATITGTVDVQFAGGSPKPLTFPDVQVVRGATTQISVLAPWVEAVAQWSGGPKLYAVDYKEAPPYGADARTLCFLADGGAYKEPDGYGRAHLVARAHYNLKAPTLDVADLPASGPFSVDKATIKRTASPATKQVPGEPTAQIPGVATLEFDVVARATAAATATVSVTVSGGELDSAQTLAWTLCTREVDKAVVKSGRAGDIAQTQLYLALILANDGLPCYRADDGATKQAVLDGTYNEALRMALFRFVYSYVGSPAWKAANVTSLKVGDGKTPATATLSPDQLATEASKIVHGDPAPQPAKDAHDARTKPSGGPRAPSVEWLVIDGALVSCIVQAFQAGAAVPVAELTTSVVLPALPPPALDGPVLDAPGFEDKQTRGMYWPDYHVMATLKGDVTQGVKADGQIDVTLPDGAPFSLAAHGGAGSQTVSTTAAALANGFEFEIAPVAGMQWTGKDAPQLRAVWRGGRNWQISQRHLPQPRDFFQKWDKDQRGLDAFLVQYCLTQATHRPVASGAAPARGFYPKSPAPKTPARKGKDNTSAQPATAHAPVDGLWTADWVKALKDYASDWSVQGTSDAVVHALLSQVLKNVPPG